MMMTKKIMALLLCGSLTAGILAGCGGSGSDSQTAEAKPETEAAAEEAPAADEEAEEAAAEETAAEEPAAEESAAEAAPADGEDKILRLGWSKDIQTMDVHRTTDNYAVPLNIFDRLLEVKLNEDGSTELVNSIAKDYSISDDGLVYSFELRDDVKFCDGTPLTSADVEATFTRMFTLEDSVQTDFTTCIKGAQAILDGNADTLEGFRVIDDTHFEIELEEPFAGFLSVLATPTCCIFSKANLEEAGDDFGMVPAKTIGSGPYMVTDWKTNDSLTLVRNPYYWGEPASASEVHYKVYPEPSTFNMAFQNGEVDILDCDFLDSSIVTSTYETDAYKDKLIRVNRLGTYMISINAGIEPMSDVRVRKAIQMAVNRQGILDSIFGGHGELVDGIYPAGSIGFTAENQGWLQYDPEGAKALLKEAGYENGFDLEISANASGSSNIASIIQVVQQNLTDVGINAHIETYDESSWLAKRKSGEMPLFAGVWTLDYNDPSNIIDTFFGSAESTKGRSLNYADTDVMARVTSAKSIVDETERLKEYADLEKKIVEEDASWVPLFALQHTFVISDRIEHFTPHWAGYGDFNAYGITMK